MKTSNFLLILFAVVVFSSTALSVNAATVIVTSVLDTDNTTGNCAANGSCTIRQAINAAVSGDTIAFNIPAPNCVAGLCTINLSLGGLIIDKSLTFEGPGAKNLIVRRADGTNPTNFTILNFTAATATTVNVTGMTIANGSSMGAAGGIANFGPIQLTLNGVFVTGGAGFGGALYNGGGTITILNSTFSDNAGSGGAILNSSGVMTIANSTISTNRGFGDGLGGGISNGIADNSTAILNLNNVTVTNNKQEADGALNAGGVRNYGTASVRNCIFSGNTTDFGTADEVRGTFISQGTNLVKDLAGSIGFGFPGSNDLVGMAAGLFGPNNFGGQTNTYSITNLFPFNSPAIDAGNNCVVTATCAVNNPPVPLTFDQRGVSFIRRSGTAVDIGAYEFQQTPTAAGVSINGRVLATNGRGLTNARVILTLANGETRISMTGSRGSFRFDDVEAGQTVILTVASRRYFYSPQVVNVIDDLTALNFVPEQTDTKLSERHVDRNIDSRLYTTRTQ